MEKFVKSTSSNEATRALKKGNDKEMAEMVEMAESACMLAGRFNAGFRSQYIGRHRVTTFSVVQDCGPAAIPVLLED